MGKGLRKREQAAYRAFAATLAADGKSKVSRELFLLLTTIMKHIIAEESRDVWLKLSLGYAQYIRKKREGWELYAELYAVLSDPQKR